METLTPPAAQNLRAARYVIAAGVVAALHVGKLPPALPVLKDVLGISLLQAGFLLSLVQLAGMTLADGKPGALMKAPASGFPREVSFLPDGRTLIATLYEDQRVELIPTPP